MLSGCSKSSALPAVHRARSKKFDPCIKTTLLASQMLLAVVDASKRITHHALEWLLKNVAQPGDSVTLLAISPLASPNWRIWEFPRLAGDCAPIPQPHKPEDGIKESCRAVIQQLQLLCESKQIKVKLKVVQTGIRGVAAVEAKKLQATWVVLDRNLKKETKYCIDELQCNVVTVNHLGSKILRLNLKYFPAGEADMPIQDLPIISPKVNSLSMESNSSPSQQQITSSTSPDPGTPFTATDPSTSSCSSSEPSTSPCLSYSAERKSPGLKSPRKSPRRTILGTGAEQPILRKSASPSVDPRRQEYDKSCIPMSSFSESKGGRSLPDYTFSSPTDYRNNLKPLAEEGDENCGDLFTLMQGERQRQRQGGVSLERTSSVRKAVSMAKQSLPGPPPLCSICQHQAPVFGRPPKRFTYAELDLATGGFCRANFLAEGGFGSVHRGVLSDGQAIAVKQHKPASAQGDKEFCAEVEVLSCAQHRNVVMLIGYCIEDSRRLLVYEFICNGSLDAHLYGRNRPTLEWCSRQKIAIGAARGLRYLHEECRVGCIVHRDMRPNNILLTHDFEPLVGDFGLARWQPDGRLGVETRVIGTFGYLAPEYTQSGQITEKADVYSLGVVLLELVTGRKAIDISRCRGEQCLVEWARPLLGERAYHELVDPRLGDCFDRREAVYMLHAASLCTRRDPYARPRMSQVLHILEGNLPSDPVDWDTPGRPSFSRPTRCSPQTKLSYEALRATYKDRISHLPSSLDDFA